MKLAGIGTILLPTDFSDASDQALTVAIELAGLLGTPSIELFHVSVDPTFVALPPGDILPAPVDLTENVDQDTNQLETVAERVRRFGINCTVSTGSGRTHVEIVEHAVTIGAGLIVMGTHEHSGISHTLLGSVAEKVLRHAPCPVLVVPLIAQAAEERVTDPFSMASELVAQGA